MTLIDKAEVLAILAPAPNAKDGLWAKRKKALYDRVAALAPTDAAQSRKAAVREAAAVVTSALDGAGNHPTAIGLRAVYADLANRILALIGETRT